ncbi:MarR family winged helix-turn-helix transcriptional regulator [Aestuariibacter sp. AA17]|uniref:MarR family winged helix-turn-helix transcriptional regulator n=2 Tax=Fluctibacter corallii TaxID=2984329 RepID=A0ABT3ACE4_9ALTE|nr:MarR family winged helix-turn-helix transcriptional regulator [Aestuariibacter sp. AA17]
MKEFTDIINDVASRCVAVRTLSTARSITRHYDNALRPVGLTITQFTLLVTIAKVAPESISQIAELLFMERTSVSRNLSLLEKQGLIQRGHAKEARKRPVALTPQGQNTLREAYQCWESAQSQLENEFNRDELQNTMLSLRALRNIC